MLNRQTCLQDLRLAIADLKSDAGAILNTVQIVASANAVLHTSQCHRDSSEKEIELKNSVQTINDNVQKCSRPADLPSYVYLVERYSFCGMA